MSAYTDFKNCLIAGWPGSSVGNCAQMVMIDHKIPLPSGFLTSEGCLKAQEFIESFNMPFAFGTLKSEVCRYLAVYYPKTSAALFNGASKEAARAVFMKEKKVKPAPSGRGRKAPAKKTAGAKKEKESAGKSEKNPAKVP